MEFKDFIDIIVPILVIIIGYLVIYFGMISKIKERLTALETKIEPFWEMVQKELPKILHSPHTPELDVLLEKMANGNINKIEAEDLKIRLRSEIGDVDAGKKLATVLLLTRLEQIINGDSKK